MPTLREYTVKLGVVPYSPSKQLAPFGNTGQDTMIGRDHDVVHGICVAPHARAWLGPGDTCNVPAGSRATRARLYQVVTLWVSMSISLRCYWVNEHSMNMMMANVTLLLRAL